MKGIECACYGVVGSDTIEIKISKSDKPWTSFSLGVDVGEDKPQWLRVSCFGEVAERVAAGFKKNDRAYIEGLIRLDHWNDKYGEAKHGLSVSAFKIEKVGVSALGRNRPKRDAEPKSSLAGTVYREKPRIQGLNDDRDHRRDELPI